MQKGGTSFFIFLPFDLCLLPFDFLYSYLSATSGSTFVARRAGIQHASNATAIRSAATDTIAQGSRAERAGTAAASARAMATAPTRPIPAPSKARNKPLPNT